MLSAIPTVELRDQLAMGVVSAAELARSCVARIEAREPEVQAWAWFNADRVLARAAELDARREAGETLGPLHGLPVGVKDVIDTAGIPTENGCPLDAGRVPDADAELVARLEAAGAIMFGKTVTTELAFLHPNKTRNPHNPEHTPGRLFFRVGRGGGRCHDPTCHWNADRWVCHSPGVLLWGCRFQAEL